jgi:arsenate reductase (glutaredoxin)
MSVIIYHNPRCSKSRQTLALIHDRGIEPEVVEYLKQPPTVDELQRIIGMLGIPAHQLVRSTESEYAGLGLSADSSEAELLEAIAREPRLLQRPIVVAGNQARIGRPPELVLDILPARS